MEVLACPHCDRMFHATPAILGKAIRCRECRKTFRVPADLASAELGPERDSAQAEIPTAVECVVQGIDARKCPACSRAFSMQAKFVGKTCQCRGCGSPFIVLASSGAAAASGVEDLSTPKPAVAGTNSLDPSPKSSEPDSLAEPPRETAPDAPPVVHDDGGDVLAAEPADEPVWVAVRPRRTWKSRQPVEPIRGPFRSGRY